MGTKSERQYQKEFISEFKRKSKNKIHINIDKDSPYRVHTAGYDFTISKLKVIYIECKKTTEKKSKWFLRQSQIKCKKSVLNSEGIYCVLEFSDYKPDTLWIYFGKGLYNKYESCPVIIDKLIQMVE